ncbi:hypothetical protein MPER_11799 [Moniliophthora perniciosa FA553]|nr:hypothetical protein MPER_11799 [Moniliophthora perniciosa FA553]
MQTSQEESDTVAVQEGTRHVMVPGVPVPFVVGFVVDDAQLCLLAKAWLSEELFNKAPSLGGYHSVVTREYFDPAKKDQAFLEYKDKHGQNRYLWVFGAVISMTGRQPNVRCDRKKAKETLQKEKAETFVSDVVFVLGGPPTSVQSNDLSLAPKWLKKDFQQCLLSLISPATRGIRSRHRVVPFVFGFVLDDSQLRLLAKTRLPEEVFNKASSAAEYQPLIIRKYFEPNKKKQTILWYENDHGQRRYLWIFGALASITGQRPLVKWEPEKASEMLKKEDAEFVSPDIDCIGWAVYKFPLPDFLKQDFDESLSYLIHHGWELATGTQGQGRGTDD